VTELLLQQGKVMRAMVRTSIKERMYQLIRQPKPIVDRQFEIEFIDSGVETFSFTFG
jgi:hypothetical protein